MLLKHYLFCSFSSCYELAEAYEQAAKADETEDKISSSSATNPGDMSTLTAGAGTATTDATPACLEADPDAEDVPYVPAGAD